MLFCWAKLFFATQGRFFASRTFTRYHYCSQIWSGCGRPEAGGQVRACPHTLSLPWHGIDYMIWRFQSERLTTELSTSQKFFFLGRRNWFFELSQSTVLTLFWQNFLRRRQIFDKTVKKAVFGHFLKNFDKKIAFFWRALPLKVSIYWRPRRL